MKNLILFLPILFMVFPSFGSPTPNSKNLPTVSLVPSKQVYLTRLLYHENSPSKLVVKIRDSKNRTIHRETIFAKKPTAKNYDFSKLRKGQYIITVYRKGIIIAEKKIEIGQHKNQHTINSTIIEREKGIFELHIQSLNPDDFYLEIYLDNKRVSKQWFKDVNALMKLYSLSYDPNTKIEFVVQSKSSYFKSHIIFIKP
jgi:hypothetical protein